MVDNAIQFDPYESLLNAFTDSNRLKVAKTADVPASAGGLSRMSTCAAQCVCAYVPA